jgi:hypothetical protein
LQVGRFKGWNVKESSFLPDSSTALRSRGIEFFPGFLVNNNTPLPLFFVSVASKGFNEVVSLLFATLAGRFIGVETK